LGNRSVINSAIIEQNKKVRIVKPLVIERMTVLEKGNITIHTENIFPIIKKSLYTDHEIFLRESPSIKKIVLYQLPIMVSG